MRPSVTYTPCAISSRKTGDIITFTQFEEGNLLSETHNDAESGDKSNDNAIMPPLLSEEEMDAMDSGYESDHDPMSTEMLEDIRFGSQSHPNVNRRESHYEIRDCINQRQSEWQGALKSMQNMGKGLHKVFKNFVKYIYQYLPPLGESGSEVSHFITEPRNFNEVKNLLYDINKTWLKVTLKEIKNLINNQTFLAEYPKKGEPVTRYMDVYKAKIQSDGTLDKLKLGILVWGDLQNKELVGDTWSPTFSMRNLKNLL